jgi:hypothetical protein
MKNDQTLDIHEPEYGQWEPIETAPKNGTNVLLAFPEWREAVISYYVVDERYRNGTLEYRSEGWRGSWCDTPGFRHDPGPTHWMPLPPLPVSTP